MVSLVVFRVGDLRCALPVGRITEIVPAQSGTRIPGAGDEVEGLINVRGRLLTVVEARRVLGRQGDAEAIEPSILVVRVAGRSMGLLVDEVHDLVHLQPDAIEPRGALPGVDPRIVEGVCRWDGQVVVVLDTETLLAPVFGG